MARAPSGAPDLTGSPSTPTIDPRAVTTAGQTISPPGGPIRSSENMGWGPIPVMTDGMTFYEVGQTGLRQFSGWVREEFLQSLVGRQAAQKFREMRDNDPQIGAIMYAIEATMTKVEWRIEPANDSGEGKEKSYVRVPQPSEVNATPREAYLHLTSNETIHGVE